MEQSAPPRRTRPCGPLVVAFDPPAVVSNPDPATGAALNNLVPERAPERAARLRDALVLPGRRGRVHPTRAVEVDDELQPVLELGNPRH